MPSADILNMGLISQAEPFEGPERIENPSVGINNAFYEDYSEYFTKTCMRTGYT